METFNGRESIITNAWSSRPERRHPGVDIMFRRASSDPAGGRRKMYPADVERWRSLLIEHASDLPVDFLLTWILHESGGNPCAHGIPGKETGLFQSFHPDNDVHGATFDELRAPCAPGSQKARRPLTDAERLLQVSTGIRLVRACIKVAARALQGVGARWTEGDRYCLVKLVHALPAYLHSFLRAFAKAKARPPASWAEYRAWVRSLPDEQVIAIDRAVKPWASVAQRDRLFGNAEKTGRAVGGISDPFVVPPGVRVLAASDGVVWSAEWSKRGFAVVIDHGPVGYATFYTHLSRLFVGPTKRARSGERVFAGQPLGVVGADPTDSQGLPHLHFELWKGGPGDAIDPGPLMKSWERLAPAPSPPPAVTLPQAAPRPAPHSAGPTAPHVASSSTNDRSDASTLLAVARDGTRNASLSYRPVGERGEPYPEWVRALDGKSGVYVIRELDSSGTPEVVYVGQSSSDRLYDTLTRHFQIWRRWKGFWRGQFAEGHDPGLTYDRNRVEVAVRVTPASEALDEEARLIRRLTPRDNMIGQVADDEIPF